MRGSFHRSHLGRVERAYLRMYRNDAAITQGRKCAYCREPFTLREITAEHVIARSRGGTTTKKNIKASCEPCNKLKGSMSEKLFKRFLKAPAERSIPWLMANARFRIWRRTEKAERRILRFVGAA